MTLDYFKSSTNKLRHLSIILAFFLLFSNASCGFYSFTGASISPDVETVSIGNFPNVSGGGTSGLSQSFTEALKDKFVSETDLALVKRNGDIDFQGSIVNWRIESQASTEDQSTAENRLTITVKVTYTDNIEDKTWNKTFSNFANYKSTQNLSSIEDQLISEINDQLVTDIFNAALVNW